MDELGRKDKGRSNRVQWAACPRGRASALPSILLRQKFWRQGRQKSQVGFAGFKSKDSPEPNLSVRSMSGEALSNNDQQSRP